jgi:hypothetical protein
MISVEESLTVRAQQREIGPVCGRCRQCLRSKGFQPRTLHTLFGVIGCARHVYNCALREKSVTWKEQGQSISMVEMSRHMTVSMITGGIIQ